MKTGKSLLFFICLAFAACNSLEIEQTAPLDEATGDLVVVSNSTGQRFNASIVESDRILVKFDTDFTAEIEKYDGDVQSLCELTKASSSSVSRI